MTDLILHPFRILVGGGVATARQGSDADIESQLAVVIGTRLGERHMCLPFGVPDAAYGELNASDVQTCLDRFGPDGVRVLQVDTTQVDEFTARADVQWVRRGDGR